MKIFVYGTLKRNKRNFCFLEALGAKFVREAETKPEFLLIAHEKTDIPYILEGGSTAVKGEIFEIDEKFLPALDAFESDYTRKEIVLADGEKVWCYAAPLKILNDGIY